MTNLERLNDAVRVKPSRAAMDELRGDLRAMQAMAGNRREKLAAGALQILIEMHDAIIAAESGD